MEKKKYNAKDETGCFEITLVLNNIPEKELEFWKEMLGRYLDVEVKQ